MSLTCRTSLLGDNPRTLAAPPPPSPPPIIQSRLCNPGGDPEVGKVEEKSFWVPRPYHLSTRTTAPPPHHHLIIISPRIPYYSRIAHIYGRNKHPPPPHRRVSSIGSRLSSRNTGVPTHSPAENGSPTGSVTAGNLQQLAITMLHRDDLNRGWKESLKSKGHF